MLACSWLVSVQTSYIESEPDNNDPEEDEAALHRSELGLRTLAKKVSVLSRLQIFGGMTSPLHDGQRQLYVEIACITIIWNGTQGHT